MDPRRTIRPVLLRFKKRVHYYAKGQLRALLESRLDLRVAGMLHRGRSDDGPRTDAAFFSFSNPIKGKPMLQLLLLIAFVQSPTDIEAAYLKTTIASQEAIQSHTRGQVLMHRNAMDKAKAAKINPNVHEADGFGKNINGTYYVPNRKAQQQAIEYYRSEMKRAESNAKGLFESMVGIISVPNMEKGQVGFLGESEWQFAKIEVFQVLGPSSLLAKIAGETILIKDVGTENITDGASVTLPRPVLVVGTERYTTAIGGSKTVFAVRLLSSDEFLKAKEFAKQNKLKVEPIVRQWADFGKKVIVEGEYVSQDKTSVIVRDSQGVEHKIPLAKLSKDDRAWLKDQ